MVDGQSIPWAVLANCGIHRFDSFGRDDLRNFDLAQRNRKAKPLKFV
jgi:hypothetical protein